MHQIVVQCSLESLKGTLVPGYEHLCVLDIAADPQTRVLEMTGVELGRVIDDNKLRDAVAFPTVLDGGKLPRDVSFWKNRVFKTSHHGQATSVVRRK